MVNPRCPNRVVTITVTSVVWTTSLRTCKRVDSSGDDGDVCGFFLRTWVILTKVRCGETLGFYKYDSGGSGGNRGLVSGLGVETGVVFKWCRR